MTNQSRVGNYIINFKEELGTGNFATVFKAYHTSENQYYAAKAMQKIQIQMDEIKRNAFKEEIHTLKLKSEFLVKFVQVVEDSQHFYIMQQLCEKNLRQLMKETGKMSQNKATQIIVQIASGLNYLIKNNIAHRYITQQYRDIKPENILIKNGLIKLADFGVSKKTLHNKCYFQDPAGSLNYMSLQALKGQRYTSKCDIWSIGLIFYELLHGQAPWFKTEFSKQMLINSIQNEKIKVKATLSDSTKNFLKRCLQIQQEGRCDWKQFFAHPLFEKRFDQYNKAISLLDEKMRISLIKFNQKLKKKKINISQFFQSVYPNISHLNFDEFHRILKWADPDIQINQSLYVFQQTDRKHRAKVSLRDLQNILFKPQYHQSNSIPNSKDRTLNTKNRLSVDQKLEHFIKGQTQQDKFIKQTENISPLKRISIGKKISIIQYESDDI